MPPDAQGGAYATGVLVLITSAAVAVTLSARARRSFELHASRVHLDAQAVEFLAALDTGPLQIIAHEPHLLDKTAYRKKLTAAQAEHHLPAEQYIVFLEVVVEDFSEFETELHVHGIVRHGYQILEIHGPAVPNAIAAVLLHIRDVIGLMPHFYFRWTQGDPLMNLLCFVAFGAGEKAPVTRGILRRAEPDLTRRPWVHVG